ncbi:peptidyl-prolyl cis-trans isomerase [Reichenbachiella sp. MALMAid0571]|uniref:peptidyl-prolyl cis-trans isomerase n=1 Tax=Reichenbachiella sp. MALMAid0571 TaxID=3143939 RepID=UPI0032DF7DE9
MKKRFKILFIGLVFLSSCDLLDKWTTQADENKVVDSKPIARVNDIYLYEKDIKGLVPNSIANGDSANIIAQYIDSWIKKQLMISKASREIEFNKADIERKVLDYRYALMAHDFEKYFINKNLDKEVSAEEIEEYYKEKFENFVLRKNIVRCLFAKIPKQAPQINTFRNQIRSFPKSNIEEIQSYCYRFATKSSLEADLWLNFDEVISNTPLANIQDRVTFLKNNSFNETSDEEYYYYIRLLEYKISNQISPLEFIRDDIESILINKKKVQLRKILEDEVYKEAKEKNEFAIY